jgi:hypothetical protein
MASLIEQFGNEFIQAYQQQLLPGHLKALSAMENCRSTHAPKMLMHCDDCSHQILVPHSCGHRHCPHCQNHESQQWIERQLQKQVPADYFMLTFTLPAQLRSLSWQHQRLVYGLLFDCVWATLKQFSLNDKQLGGVPGAIAVLHTHSRELNFHPHLHIVMPAGTIDKGQRLWSKKSGKYLFSHKALAKVFRAKLLDALTDNGLTLPSNYPEKWVVDCRHVGQGNKALVYLGRYLYRGVIQEKDILSCHNGQVTFRYQDSKTKKYQTRTTPVLKFLWLVLQHILPRGFRRARDYGFLHPNSKKLIQVLQWVFRLNIKNWMAKIKPRRQMSCACCGAPMRIVKTQIPNCFYPPQLSPS